MTKIDSKIPEGPVAEKWTNYKAHQKLVNPANKRRLDIIVVGTGLAGASAAASLGEMGFRVFNFCIQDSPRRAHSIAAQGGVVQQNAAVEAFQQLPALIGGAAVLAVGVGLPQKGHTVESVKYLRYSVGYNVVFLDRLDLTGGLAGEFDFGVTMDGHGKVPPLGFTKCFLPVPCAAAW